MESSTETGIVFEIGSLYAHFRTVRDSRNPKGMRYQLVTILVMVTVAKLCGQDTPSGIAEWVKHRAKQFIEALGLKYKAMPHHTTYRRILGQVISVDGVEQMVSSSHLRRRNWRRADAA